MARLIPAPYVEDLVEVMANNLDWHGRRWRKVRADRIGKLWPELDEAEVGQVVEAAVADGRVERCTMEDRDTREPIPGLKLANIVDLV